MYAETAIYPRTKCQIQIPWNPDISIQNIVILLKIKYAISILGNKIFYLFIIGIISYWRICNQANYQREEEDWEDRKASIQAWKGKSVESTSYSAD